MPKKILIADDHPIIRMGVKQICEREYPGVQFGDAVNYAEVCQRLTETDWDLLILDLDMPGRNGLDILKQIKTNKNKLPVLIFSFHNEEQIALRAFKTGDEGYVNKDVENKELNK